MDGKSIEYFRKVEKDLLSTKLSEKYNHYFGSTFLVPTQGELYLRENNEICPNPVVLYLYAQSLDDPSDSIIVKIKYRWAYSGPTGNISRPLSSSCRSRTVSELNEFDEVYSKVRAELVERYGLPKTSEPLELIDSKNDNGSGYWHRKDRWDIPTGTVDMYMVYSSSKEDEKFGTYHIRLELAFIEEFLKKVLNSLQR